METEQAIQNEKNLVERRKQKLSGIAGLKFIAVLLMFYWHSELTAKWPSLIDFGARCCEFLFVVSGFLVVYNYKRKYDNIFKETISYSAKKIIKMWPLHIGALVAILFIERATFSLSSIPSLILNAFLLQSWSSDASVIMSFNGISWFLSAILFCYILTPILVKLCKNYKLSLVILPILIVLRLMLDRYLPNLGFLSRFLNMHTSCFVRITEFLMGMLLCPIFLKIKEKIQGKEKLIFYLFSCLEIVILLGIILAMRFLSQSRAFFAALMCVVVFVFAFDSGILSKAFSYQPVKILSNIQYEFFILHVVVLIIIEALWFKKLHLESVLLCDAIALAVLIAFCCFYKIFIEKQVDKVMKKLFNKLFRITKINIAV